MVRAEKITAGSAGKGTRFRSAASMGRTAEMLTACAGYDRPELPAAATMTQAGISCTLGFEPVAAGTRMRWSGHVRPRALSR